MYSLVEFSLITLLANYYPIIINLQAAGMVPIGITLGSSHITSPVGTFSREKIFKVRLGHIHKYAGRLQDNQFCLTAVSKIVFLFSVFFFVFLEQCFEKH